jgi:hypothetical protein
VSPPTSTRVTPSPPFGTTFPAVTCTRDVRDRNCARVCVRVRERCECVCEREWHAESYRGSFASQQGGTQSGDGTQVRTHPHTRLHTHACTPGCTHPNSSSGDRTSGAAERARAEGHPPSTSPTTLPADTHESRFYCRRQSRRWGPRCTDLHRLACKPRTPNTRTHACTHARMHTHTPPTPQPAKATQHGNAPPAHDGGLGKQQTAAALKGGPQLLHSHGPGKVLVG